jgi:hypothetical protein
MRSAIYGVIFTAFLASAGIVQAGDLDGKALLCTDGNKSFTYTFGLVFDQGKVTSWMVKGYIKTIQYTQQYQLRGTTYVDWKFGSLNRETLKALHLGQCAVSSKTKIFQNWMKSSQRQKRRIRFRSLSSPDTQTLDLVPC